MSDDQKTYAIVGAAVVIGLVVWIALVLVPAWGSYSRLWDRLLATLLSVYVLGAFVLLGAGAGALVLWYSDRL
jgi:Kef-type K+ transport system membrane component KefB